MGANARQDNRYTPIADYAIIGNCGSAALVSKEGSIDWLCWPRFDSPSVFAALLDADKGGYYQICPTGLYTVERQYMEHTNILETTFTTEGGVLRLTDLMPVAPFEAYTHEFWPDHEVLRAVECVEGEVEVEITCDPRLDYARLNPTLEDRGEHGFFYDCSAGALVVRSEIPLTLSKHRGSLHGRTTLQAGERRFLAMSYEDREPAVMPLLGEHAEWKIERSAEYWREWAAQCQYEGPYREAVVRSALTLKLMTYARSGAIIAAPTTSLPESIGGERNWDYRYCWLRDASLTLRALFGLGYEKEGEAFFSWILHTTWSTLPEVNVLYDVHGNSQLTERTLDHLEGYRESKPVRIGNGAHKQFQLDIYGEVISAAHEFVMRGGHLDQWQARMLYKLGNEVCKRWQEPDEGIWEVRSGRHQHTYSKVMCWVAIDRLIKLHKEEQVQLPSDCHAMRDEIRRVVEQRGYNEELGSYVSTLDGDKLDASLLLLPIYGYTEATAPRMRSTFERIQEKLAHGSLMYRYTMETDDGLWSPEGAFGLCSFWDEEILARLGRIEAAKEHFEQTFAFANDVGLFAEEIDPETGEALGNFPQAFTHIGLINSALTIAATERSGVEAVKAGQYSDKPVS